MDANIESFIKHYCSHVFQYDGNACLVIGGQKNINLFSANLTPSCKVPVYDLDAGEIFNVALYDISIAQRLRKVESSDYEFCAIQDWHRYDETQEIIDTLDSVNHFD